MNPILEKWINEQKNFEKAARDKHLLSLGLKSNNGHVVKKRKLVDANTPNSYKGEDGLYYIDEDVLEFNPIEVTDEEYAEICKYAPVKKNYDESTLEQDVNSIRKWVAFFGILTILGLISAFLMYIFLRS